MGKGETYIFFYLIQTPFLGNTEKEHIPTQNTTFALF
jgi:hypothetical protein